MKAMNGRIAGFLLLSSALLAWQAPGAQKANSTATQGAANAQQRTAGEAFKNLMVLDKNMPEQKVWSTMQFVATSLGVNCGFCHDTHNFSDDSIKAKQTAREMMSMEMAIDKQFFDGHPEVTCNTCHRGAPSPKGLPEPTQAMWYQRAHGGAETERQEERGPLPAADALVEKYRAAVGVKAGSAAPTQVATAEATIYSAMSEPLSARSEFAISGDKVAVTNHLPNNTTMQVAWLGDHGWMKDNSGVHDLSGRAAEMAKSHADAWRMDQTAGLTAVRTLRKDKVGERDAYMVLAKDVAGKPTLLYFDTESGLLLRKREFTDTALGRLAADLDFSDYAEDGGYKLPTHIEAISENSGFDMKVTSRKINVPVDERKFERPE